MGEPTEADVLARAKRTFIAKNRDDRAWDAGFTEREVRHGHNVACLTELERQEYLEQARHELRTSSPSERSARRNAKRREVE
ncbi:hypothetical protein [Methylobacterium longum]|uniref:Uncharacterized protein n=1 Tax=Methylobacterium longum TaxID=767694 RepID=A0ABT8AMJ9_9HYPH|nr:hypothetical protein [Methylobacterium longum]MDN3571023.1 hypothetical protein [Methylobacterium longum]GJE15194.1 hypothetical protein FOHLNKBM_6272 [Methylobacterium longum]